MKTLNTILLSSLLFLCQGLFATNHIITISGFTYSPSTLSANVGDTINISATNSHPLIQVDSTTWHANGTTPLSGGWGTKSSDYTFVITQAQDIYYICQFHVGMGMKGMISVSGTTVGLSKNELNKQINIYPNPGKDIIYIDSRISDRIEIFNVLGKLVFSSKLTSKLLSVKASEVGSAGNYLVKFFDHNNKATETRQLVLQ
jgi:plastocyanin